MPEPRRSRRFAGPSSALWLGVCIAAGGACAQDAFLVVGLTSSDTAFDNVGAIAVAVTGSAGTPMSATLVYTPPAGAGFSIDPAPAQAKTLSVSFTPDRSGAVNLAVAVFDATGCAGGGAATNLPLNQGGVSNASVVLHHDVSACAAAIVDAGTAVGATGPDGP